jgi:hypothetical protein
MECQFFMIQVVAKIDGSDSIIGKTKMKDKIMMDSVDECAMV